VRKFIFVGNEADFHAIDWYRTIKGICLEQEEVFATDLVKAEGHSVLITADHDIVELFNIDGVLFRNQSRVGNIWRNLVKLLAVPLQVWRLKQLSRVLPAGMSAGGCPLFRHASFLHAEGNRTRVQSLSGIPGVVESPGVQHDVDCGAQSSTARLR
jgi:hypothetical protein